jgi:hypothetical protein
VVQCKLLASKKKIIYEIIQTESLSEKQRDKLTSYFKLKKIKRISKWLHSSCYDSPIRRKKGDRLWVSFAGKCDRNADMWLTYLCSEQKIYSGYK